MRAFVPVVAILISIPTSQASGGAWSIFSKGIDDCPKWICGGNFIPPSSFFDEDATSARQWLDVRNMLHDQVSQNDCARAGHFLNGALSQADEYGFCEHSTEFIETYRSLNEGTSLCRSELREFLERGREILSDHSRICGWESDKHPYFPPDSGVQICNFSEHDRLFLSFNQKHLNGDWITEGWHYIDRGDCFQISENNKSYVYYYIEAKSDGKKFYWNGDESTDLCIDPRYAFNRVSGGTCPDGMKLKKFGRMNNFGERRYTLRVR